MNTGFSINNSLFESSPPFSFGILHQLKVAQLEEITHVPQRLRFPFFTEMCWFVLDRYVQCLLGCTHLKLPDEEKKRLKIDTENADSMVIYSNDAHGIRIKLKISIFKLYFRIKEITFI